MTDSLAIALLQHVPVPADIEAALQRLDDAASQAAGQGAQLLVVPEASVTGYNIPRETMVKVAQPADGPAAQAIAQICRKYAIAIAYGFAEARGEQFFNCVQLIDQSGERLVQYRKTHLWGDLDRELFTAGDQFAPVVEIDGWKIGLLICYDVEFPECARQLALQGAELVLVPTGLMQPWRAVAEQLVPVRAYENQIFIAYANYCGEEADLHYEGRSVIVDPNGEDLDRALQTPVLLQATLDRDTLTNARAQLPYHRDRRPELYTSLHNKPKDLS